MGKMKVYDPYRRPSRFWEVTKEVLGILPVIAALAMMIFIAYAASDLLFNGR